MRRIFLLRLLPNTRISLLDHLFAEIHADQIVLKDVVIEHVFGGFTQVDNPLAHIRRTHSESHVLGVVGAGRMIVAAYAADTAGDEVRVPWIFALHENAVSTEDGRGAMAFRDLPVFKIDLGKDPKQSFQFVLLQVLLHFQRMY